MKTIVIIIIAGIVIASILTIYNYSEDSIINFEGMNISSRNLYALTNNFQEGDFILCSLNKMDYDNPCIPMGLVNLNG